MRVAVETVHTARFGTVVAGTVVEDDADVVVAIPALFVPVVGEGRSVVESATARPGEKRGVAKKAAR